MGGAEVTGLFFTHGLNIEVSEEMQRCPLPDRILQLDPGKGKDKR